MTLKATLLVLLLVDVTYSFSSHSESITIPIRCTSPDIYHGIDMHRHNFEFQSRYEDEYSNPTDEQEDDPCKDISTVRVNCPYDPYDMTGSYTLSVTICPKDRVSFYFNGRLGFRDFHISSLHGSSFRADFKISELHLENHGIAKIAPGAFNYQSTIDSIFLRTNNLSMITVGIFNSLTHLHTLDLSENQIENINDDAFSSVPLSQLMLSRNKLKSLPDALFDIRRLDVSHNSIEQISPSGIFKTRALNVSYNDIKYFNTTCFPWLEELYLAYNKLEEIELQISMIRKLDVSNNAISAYPENLGSLVMLNIGGNKISHLPNMSVHGEALIELYLGGNNLTHIPSIFFKELTSLNILDLSGNKLSSFTFGTFDNLLSLERLNISHNNFKTFPIYTLHAVRSLRYVYFSDNEITDFNVEELLKHLPQLKMLDFKGNRLSCQNLLDVVHKLKDHGVDFKRGIFTETDNIYGIKCDHVSELRDANINLPLTSHQDLKNSSFARYIDTLSRASASFTQNQQILDGLLEMDKKQNEVLDQIITRLNGSGVEQGALQKILLQNYSLGNADFANFTIGTFKELLTRYSDASNVMKNISLDILETDKKQNELLNRLISEQSIEADMSKGNFTMFEKFINILNDTDQKQDEIMKVYSGLGTDVKKALDALEKTQINIGHFIEEILGSNQIKNDSFLALTDKTEKAEALHSYPEKNENPVFIFIALLLTTMTILMFSLLYLLFYRVKYIVNTKLDVEMNQLLESKSDITNN